MKASKAVNHEARVLNLARRICDAAIDAAVIEYTKTVLAHDTVSIERLEARLAELRRGAAQWPTHETRKTVETVSTARGNFTW